MDQIHEIDITAEIQAGIDAMKDGDIILAPNYTLFDTMSATELFDAKIDIKLGLDDADTPLRLLKAGKIKTADQISLEEVLGLYDLVLSKEMLWYQGNALAQTVYTLVPQYEASLVSGNEYLEVLFGSLNSNGSCTYNIVKGALYLREEDYIPSIFSFPKNTLPLEKFLTDHAKVQQQAKKKKKIDAADGIIARIKLRKSVGQLLLLLNSTFNEENKKQILSQIEQIRNKMPLIRETIPLAADVSGYESKTIYTHILAMISKRGVPTLSVDETYNYLENMMTQIETIMSLSSERDLFTIIDGVDNLVHKNPKNVVVRAYLEVNLFTFNPINYFGQITLLDLCKRFLANMFPYIILESDNAEVVGYYDYLSQILFEYICKMLRGNFRQMRDFHKIYQHFSILIHESTKIDEIICKGRTPLMIFSYELSLRMMIKQLMLGFELEIYDQSEYSFIFFYLEYLLIVFNRNRANYFNGLPLNTQTALKAKQKKKKIVNDLQERLYNENAYYKGLESLYKGHSRLAHILTETSLIRVPAKENLNHRYSNRMKIFEQCYFIKPVSFYEYVERMQETYKDNEQRDSGLNQVSGFLKEAGENFKQIEEKMSPQWMVDLQKVLQRSCVVSSVNIMKLKMSNPPKASITLVGSSFIPQLELM